jgi:hypothetical protein
MMIIIIVQNVHNVMFNVNKKLEGHNLVSPAGFKWSSPFTHQFEGSLYWHMCMLSEKKRKKEKQQGII